MGERYFAPTASVIFRSGSIRPSCRIKVVHLKRPVIINLREDRTDKDPHARDLLRPEEISYFRRNGNNATIFIHGFNVPYGRYGHHTELVEWEYDILRNRPKLPRLIYSSSFASTYRDRDVLDSLYAQWRAKNPGLYDEIRTDDLNGSGAHAWYIHMEDNLNCATGQFHRSDYRKYTRLINLAWSGDVSAVNYMEAETRANKAGFGLARIVDQLAAEGIAVNIIAHSLGNRVLLVGMNLLGQMPNRQECIANAFMWQPAVPDTALSNDPGKDTSVLRNWNFVYAHRAAKKIIVLYSNRDNILGAHKADADLSWNRLKPTQSFREDWTNGEHVEAGSGGAGGIYRLATRVGVPGSDLIFAPWSMPELYCRNFLGDNLPAFEKALQAEIASDTDGLFTDHLAPTWEEMRDRHHLGPFRYARRISKQMAEDAMKTVRALVKADWQVKTPRPAMGYGGPEQYSDLFIRRLIEEEKIIMVNQAPKDKTPWLTDHSGMMIPSEILSRKIYDEQIMRLIIENSGFGSY